MRMKYKSGSRGLMPKGKVVFDGGIPKKKKRAKKAQRVSRRINRK